MCKLDRTEEIMLCWFNIPSLGKGNFMRDYQTMFKPENEERCISRQGEEKYNHIYILFISLFIDNLGLSHMGTSHLP